MKYQGRTLVPVKYIIKSKSILNSLEKLAKPEENIMIDVKPAFYKFKIKRGSDFEKYNLYTVRKTGESETPRFLTSVDRLIRNGKKASKYRINL